MRRNEKMNEFQNIVNKKIMNSIYPFVSQEKKGEFELGNNYTRTICFAEYPEEVKGDWLSPLKRIKGNITITQHLDSASSSTMIEFYNNTIKNKKSELENSFDPKRSMLLKKEIESAELQLQEALSDKSGFIYIYTYVLMQASTLDELNRLESKVKMALTKMKVRALVPYYRMADACFSAMPIFHNALADYTYQMSNTTAASSMYMFDNNEICDMTPGADVVGMNKKNGSLISVNYADTARVLNRNVVVFGTSGVGKTTLLKDMIYNKIAKGENLYILDPENEYGEIVRKYGGEVINMSTLSDSRINPFQFFTDELTIDEVDNNIDEQRRMEFLIKQKVTNLKGFFKMLKSDIDQVELAIVEKQMYDLYKPLLSHSFEELTNEDFPVLQDLKIALEKLQNEDAEQWELIRTFYYIVESNCETLFNGKTNVNMESTLVCFNLLPLQNEKSLQDGCYFNIFAYLWDKLTNGYKEAKKLGNTQYRSTLIADEFHFLLTNEESTDFYFQAYKRFRKFMAACVSATQQVLDVLNAKMKDDKMDVGTAITENSFTKIFFGLDDKGVDDIVSKLRLNLSREELAILRAKRQGEAVFLHGTKRALLKVRLSKEELRQCNPKAYEEHYGDDPTVEPDYTKDVYISQVEREEIYSYGGDVQW